MVGLDIVLLREQYLYPMNKRGLGESETVDNKAN